MHRLTVGLVTIAALAAMLTLSLNAGARTTADVYISFRMPSKNIHCGYSHFTGEAPYLRCDIQSGIKPPPQRKKLPECTWGVSVGMNKTGMAKYLCVSDTVYDERAKSLAYGTTWQRGGFRCTSRETGLTCKNTIGHGFFMSREKTRLF